MASTKAAVQLALALGVLVMWLVAADSVIRNASTAAVLVDERIVDVGENVTISLNSTHTSAAISISYTRTITNIKISNNKTYFVVSSQSGNTSTLAGQYVTTLDLVQSITIESSF